MDETKHNTAHIAASLSITALRVLELLPVRPDRGLPALGAILPEIAEDLGLTHDEILAAVRELSRHFGPIRAKTPYSTPTVQYSLHQWAWAASRSVLAARRQEIAAADVSNRLEGEIIDPGAT
jgi:hypothetical protein